MMIRFYELISMRIIICCLGILFIFSNLELQAKDHIQAIPLVKLKIESEQLSKICDGLNLKCADGAALWKKKSARDSQVYLIDDSQQLIQLEQIQNRYKIIDQWNFKNYVHHSQQSFDDDLADYGTEIFPAFYPLNRDKVAVALVKQYGAGYSGGGRGVHVADFLMLEPEGKFKTALVEIPFYSYEMIRACFSEKDYKISPHCHDESGSTLSIQFKDVGKPFYQWTLNYTDFTWESGKPEKSKTITKSRVVAMPFEKDQ